MGFTPSDVAAMSLWEWTVAFQAFRRFNSTEEQPATLTGAETEQLWQLVKGEG